MNVSEAVGALRAALDDVDHHLPLLDNSADHVETAKAAVKSLEDQKSKSLADLRALKAEQDRQQATNQQKLAELDADVLNKTKANQDQIDAMQHIHDDLSSKVKALQNQHDQLLASLESLKKRFA